MLLLIMANERWHFEIETQKIEFTIYSHFRNIKFEDILQDMLIMVPAIKSATTHGMRIL